RAVISLCIPFFLLMILRPRRSTLFPTRRSSDLRAFEREIQRRCAQALPPGQQAPGSPANHQAVDGILRLQHGSSRRRQLLCLKTAQKNAWLAVSAEHNLTFSLILEGWASTSFPLQ